MSLVTSILTAGTNSHQTTAEEANRFLTNFVSPGFVGAITNTSGVAPMTGSFAVNAAATPNKTVIISTGDVVVTATPTGQASQNLNIRNTGSITTTIADNVSGATRYDWIYVVVDATNSNNPNTAGDNAASIIVNRSTSSSSDTAGAPAFNRVIAVVTISNGFTTITNGNIADRRTSAGAAVPDSGISVATKLTNPYKFYAYRSTSETVTSSKVHFDAKAFDTSNNFDATTNRFTVPVNGFYQLNTIVGWVINGNNGIAYGVSLSKNGSIYANGSIQVNMYSGGPYGIYHTGSWFLQLVAGDYLEIYTIGAAGGNSILSGVGGTSFSGYLVSPS